MANEYLSLDKLEVYKLARQLSSLGWEIYQELDWREKKINGDQFLESTDSVGGNVAEGFGRFHFLDKVKFYFNARGSLFESRHWLDLMTERKMVKSLLGEKYLNCYKNLGPALNGLIESTLRAKNKSEKS